MDVAATNPYQKVVQAQQNEQLILEHLHYVRHVLGRTVAELPEGIDLENLEAAGILGLVEAAAQFDPAREVAFTTFAYLRIRGAILDELRRNCPLSRSMLKRWELIRSVYAKLEPPVAPENLSAATGLSLDDVLECLQSIRLTNPDAWHEDLAGGTLLDDQSLPPAAAIEHEDDLSVLADAIAHLPDQERTVLTLYHMEELRLKEIGIILGLSESRVSRVLAAAELRLKETVRRRTSHDDNSHLERKLRSHDSHTSDRTGVAGEPHTPPRRGHVPLGSGSHR
ncbi:MAG: sigma-70 family RNA polymerase sigma factor [Planctomycetaceae bacterium]|nr:sigma-70 family RNA polymerase sigma factor [Planctomycetaceae bacterium]